MNLPSVKTLSQVFGDNAKQARQILELTSTAGKLTEFDSVVLMRKTCYHSPTKLMVKFAALNELAETYGVEACETLDGGEYLEYLNTGDCYTPTIMNFRGRWFVGTLGGFLETARVKFK